MPVHSSPAGSGPAQRHPAGWLKAPSRPGSRLAGRAPPFGGPREAMAHGERHGSVMTLATVTAGEATGKMAMSLLSPWCKTRWAGSQPYCSAAHPRAPCPLRAPVPRLLRGHRSQGTRPPHRRPPCVPSSPMPVPRPGLFCGPHLSISVPPHPSWPHPECCPCPSPWANAPRPHSPWCPRTAGPEAAPLSLPDIMGHLRLRGCRGPPLPQSTSV